MKLFGIPLRKPSFNEVTAATIMAVGLWLACLGGAVAFGQHMVRAPAAVFIFRRRRSDHVDAADRLHRQARARIGQDVVGQPQARDRADRTGMLARMAVAVEVLDHRHLGLAADALDQALAAARDDHVHVLGHEALGPSR